MGYGVIQETIQNIVLNVIGEFKVHEIVSNEVLVKSKHYFRSSKYVYSLTTASYLGKATFQGNSCSLLLQGWN